MMKISGFTLIHNYSVGYPLLEAIEAVRPHVDEIVAVDMESTDDTREILKNLGCRVLLSAWEGEGDERLKNAYKLHHYCKGDVILLFEADEVFDESLLNKIRFEIAKGHDKLGFYRIQVEANFQRVRWYPHAVFRVFRPGTVDYYPPHPVECPSGIPIIQANYGYLWDCSNIFRDQWHDRKKQQAEIWQHNRTLSVSEHFAFSNEVDPDLNAPYWTWTDTPLRIPESLRHLLGKTRYKIDL